VSTKATGFLQLGIFEILNIPVIHLAISNLAIVVSSKRY
jgi:hypothetical protein